MADKEDDSKKDEKPEGEDKKGKEEKPQKPPPRWPLVVAGIVAAIFAIVVLLIIFVPGTSVWTDDAYVTAHYSTIAPRVAGQISAVMVDDNQPVHAGQLLATIDDRDFRSSLASAEAQLQRDRAQVQDATATLERQPAVIAQSQAQARSSEAQLGFARANQARYRNLAKSGAGTFQDRQQAETSLKQAEEQVASNAASAEAAKRQIPIEEAQRRSALAGLKADEARVEQARLNLSYTRILAPLDGMVTQRSTQVGNYVAPGAALMALVPLGQVYIEANYRELSLRHVLPGQHVRIHVDAYDIFLEGVVNSIPPASGTAFAPIQPNNATGNFTKIVQRLPVKIDVTPGQNLARLLRAGFSVETTIDTGHADVAGAQQGTAAPVTVR